MFIEPQRIRNKSHLGWLEVICGSMFSGKTEELIRRLKRAKIANQKVEIFKPGVDTRYDLEHIVSHNENMIPSFPVRTSREIIKLAQGADVIGVDEAQFFDEELPSVCTLLANKGIRIVIAGLDMDFEGRPFGTMPQLLAMAEYVTKVHAICQQCGEIAVYSFRKTSSRRKVLLGEKDVYEPRCRACFIEGNGEKSKAGNLGLDN